MFYNFFSNPTPSSADVAWRPATHNEIDYLYINHGNFAMHRHLRADKAEFWNVLVPRLILLGESVQPPRFNDAPLLDSEWSADGASWTSHLQPRDLVWALMATLTIVSILTTCFICRRYSKLKGKLIEIETSDQKNADHPVHSMLWLNDVCHLMQYNTLSWILKIDHIKTSLNWSTSLFIMSLQ